MLRFRLRSDLLATAVAMASFGCGSDLTLPGDGAPARLVRVSGHDQRAEAGSRLDDPLVVAVVDAEGRPVKGARVVFGFAGDPEGAGVTPERASTGDDGRAAAEAVLGVVPGEQLVEARLEGSDDPDLRAVFSLTALGGSRGAGGGGGGGSGGDRDDDDDDDDDDDRDDRGRGGGGGGGGGDDDDEEDDGERGGRGGGGGRDGNDDRGKGKDKDKDKDKDDNDRGRPRGRD